MIRNLKTAFLNEVNAAREASKFSIPSQMNSIKSLPKLLQGFLNSSGYDFSKKISLAKIQWEDTLLRFTQNSKWNKVTFYQINFLQEPVRLVYMKYSWLGLFPLEAIDSYTIGEGNMLVRLMSIFTIQDAKGVQMDLSELVTILAEVIFIPHYALRKYIIWEQVDEFRILATVTHNSLIARGIFHFNSFGECTLFETQDRYFTDKTKGYIKRKWIAKVEQYKMNNGVKFPSRFSTAWVDESGEYQYFKGTVSDIKLYEK